MSLFPELRMASGWGVSPVCDVFRQCALRRPPQPSHPGSQQLSFDPSFARPLHQGLCFAEGSNQPIVALVVALLKRRGPAAVGWLVVAVVLAALDGVLGRRARPHVRQERREAVPPSLAHVNATPSISTIEAITWISAAHLHGNPDQVFGCVRQAVGFSWHGLSFPQVTPMYKSGVVVHA